jgi:hypothetical protein
MGSILELAQFLKGFYAKSRIGVAAASFPSAPGAR